MRAFMDENFLLTTETARHLYHDFAKDMPIFDYHCHLSPKEIAEDVRFENIGQLMLGGDHYKWRAMTAFGIDERLIRGDAPYYEKFLAYAGMMPYIIGNPLYHWTHLELQRVFGIYDVLNEKTAPAIWEKANRMLGADGYSAKALIRKFNVRMIGTTDDPTDDLAYHEEIAKDAGFGVKVLPSFRPDKAVNCERAGFTEYIMKLSAVSGKKIATTDDVIHALLARLMYFHERGARIADHGLETVPFEAVDPKKADEALRLGLSRLPVPDDLRDHYRTKILLALGEKYHELQWTQQYHMNAMRNNSARMFELCGPDAGFDSLSDGPVTEKLQRLMDAQDRKNCLPRTVLYSLNPMANAALAAMAGNFQGDGLRGKVQFGSAWWFNDTRDGMTDQMKTLSNIGVFGSFIGMLTDSRSFTSYPRHEYFRRILCQIVGEWVENGEYPADDAALERIIRGICYDNAAKYFGIEL